VYEVHYAAVYAQQQSVNNRSSCHRGLTTKAKFSVGFDFRMSDMVVDCSHATVIHKALLLCDLGFLRYLWPSTMAYEEHEFDVNPTGIHLHAENFNIIF
jgi:hypothetical protein